MNHDRSMGRPLGPTRAAIDDAAYECERLTALKAGLMTALDLLPAGPAWDAVAEVYDDTSDALTDAAREYWELTGEDYQ